ncbi:MAG: glucose 1-dehydrogenase [Chloroflexi bacterium]|nr:MAG: glucose 1-dehydrogenase [Chloroflexota bacterium]
MTQNSANTRRLGGRVAVVTGSSGGIGLAIATEFAREGASVVVNSRDAERAEKAASTLAQEGLRVSGFAADMRRPEEARALAQTAATRYGRLDIWVNNAGINVIKPALELEADEWAAVIDTNLSACFYGSQAAGRLMVPQKSGVIIQIGSIIGEVGLPRRVPYTAAKHGLIGLTKVLAAEWARDNVRVVCLDPGYISTGLGVKSQARGAFTAADIERRTPMGRFGEAAEVARVAVFLASDDASYITGSHVTVDGGWIAYGGW